MHPGRKISLSPCNNIRKIGRVTLLSILLSGCNGKMGQVVTRLSAQYDNLKIAAGFDMVDNRENPYPVFTDLKHCNIKIDVIIDFSSPAAFDSLITFSAERKYRSLSQQPDYLRCRKCLGKLQVSSPYFIPPICRWVSTC